MAGTGKSPIHQFSQIPKAEIQRSKFRRPSSHKTTLDAGYLVPIFIDEALLGDTFTMRATNFMRMATPIVPLMDNVFVDTFWFSVPVRLVWENWEKFNGAQTNPGDSTDFEVPYTAAPLGGWVVGELEDYFGLPTGVNNLQASALFHRAYALVWDAWFRDEDLQDSINPNLGDGPDVYGAIQLMKRGKRHDYFTSARPWPQKGAAVQVPIQGTAPVISDPGGAGYPTFTANAVSIALRTITGSVNTNWSNSVGATANAFWETPGLVADLSGATATTINQIREAFQIQRLYERDARGGTRYTEILRSHFRVESPDQRLQRPEFLGGGSQNIMTTPVAQTTQAIGVSDPLATLGAYAMSTAQNGFSHSFVEHCIVIGLVSVRADLNYQQGLDRMFKRSTRWDFYWPALAHLGEQAIELDEIYAQGTAEDQEVFGYQERYAEYRYARSRVTGQFRSTFATPLDVWHLAQEFSTKPILGDTFIQENPPMDRVLAVPNYPNFLYDGFFDLTCARPMPMYGVPGLMDHF